MASVRFYIEKRRDEHGRTRTRNVPILLFFSFEGKRLQLNTGERMNALDWDADKQLVRDGAPGSKNLNLYLQSLGQEVMDIYREAKAMGIETGREYLRGQLKYRRKKDGVDFFETLMRFIDENHSKWSIHTFRKVRTTYNHLRKFSESEQIHIQFNRIDKDFLDRYARFFRIKYGHSNNTIVKNINILKWFLNWAFRRGYNKSSIYREYELAGEAKPRVKLTDLVLDWEELKKLDNLEPTSDSLKEVRDIFCFMCFSGLKLPRVYQLKVSNVFSDYASMPGDKGKVMYNLPLNRRATQILQAYQWKDLPGGTIFPYYHNAYFNKLLKQLGKEAGINRFVNLEIYSGQERGSRQVPKFEILTSKVAVNTFLFNGLKLGISADVLSYVTNSKTHSGVERIRPLLEHSAFDDIQKFNSLSG